MSVMVRVKVCGITRLEDALLAIELGADALGFIFYPKSPRNISIEDAKNITGKLPPFVQTVGVFVNEEVDVVRDIARSATLDIVQLHGNEDTSYMKALGLKFIKALRVSTHEDVLPAKDFISAGASAILLDTYKVGIEGGTGETFDWEIALKAKEYGPIVLSGGLNPENVASAIAQVSPYAIDVCSGVEASPGKKDIDKMRAFFDAL